MWQDWVPVPKGKPKDHHFLYNFLNGGHQSEHRILDDFTVLHPKSRQDNHSFINLLLGIPAANEPSAEATVEQLVTESATKDAYEFVRSIDRANIGDGDIVEQQTLFGSPYSKALTITVRALPDNMSHYSLISSSMIDRLDEPWITLDIKRGPKITIRTLHSNFTLMEYVDLYVAPMPLLPPYPAGYPIIERFFLVDNLPVDCLLGKNSVVGMGAVRFSATEAVKFSVSSPVSPVNCR